MAFTLDDTGVQQARDTIPEFSDSFDLAIPPRALDFESMLQMPTFIRDSPNLDDTSPQNISQNIAKNSRRSSIALADIVERNENEDDDNDNNHDKAEIIPEMSEEEEEEEEEEEVQLELENVNNGKHQDLLTDDEDDAEMDEEKLSPPPQPPIEQIGVFLRIRPVPADSIVSPNYRFDDEREQNTLWIENATESGKSKSKKIQSFSSTASSASSSSASQQSSWRSVKNSDFNYYKFNRIFSQSTEQWPVVSVCAVPLLSDFILGQNSLLFTYGITSSGKSYTMRGTGRAPGIIPSSLAVLFEALRPYTAAAADEIPRYKPAEFCSCFALTDRDRATEAAVRSQAIRAARQTLPNEMKEFDKFVSNLNETQKSTIDQLAGAFRRDLQAEGQDSDSVSVGIWISYYEIYNEKIYDLLESIPFGGVSAKFAHDLDRRESRAIQIFTNKRQQHYVKGVRLVYAANATEAFALFLLGQSRLRAHIAETALNSQSSRSHSSFNLTMIRVTDDLATISNLAFCDLAGRERIKKANVHDIRQQIEANKINKSLMFLGQCLTQLRTAQRSATSGFTNFRQSKLTQIFQPYLSGSGGRTYIIYNLNPSEKLFDESYYSLDFCQIAKDIRQERQFRLRKSIQNLRLSITGKIDDAIGGKSECGQAVERSFANISAIITDSSSLATDKWSIEREQLTRQIGQLRDDMQRQERALKSQLNNDLEKLEDQYWSMLKAKDASIDAMREIYQKRQNRSVEAFKKEQNRLADRIKEMEMTIFEKDEKIVSLEIRIKECEQKCVDQAVMIEQNGEMIREKDETINGLIADQTNQSISFKRQRDEAAKEAESKRNEEMRRKDLLIAELKNRIKSKEKFIEQQQALYESKLEMVQTEAESKRSEEMSRKDLLIAELKNRIKSTTKFGEQQQALYESRLKMVQTEAEKTITELRQQLATVREANERMKSSSVAAAAAASAVISNIANLSSMSTTENADSDAENRSEDRSKAAAAARNNRQKKTKKTTNMRNRSRVSADTRLFLKSLNESNCRSRLVDDDHDNSDDHHDIRNRTRSSGEMPNLDQITFSARRDNRVMSAKKRLHASAAKMRDTSPIESPMDATNNIKACESIDDRDRGNGGEQSSRRRYNTRNRTYRRALFSPQN